uniref:Serpin family A member 1 n=1 Tax=Monodelphis domestica TaxID=13616 RepID=F6VB36_MONDO
MPSTLTLCLLLAGLCSLVPSHLAEEAQASEDTGNYYSSSRKIAPYMTGFSIDLYKVLVSKSNTTNIFFSPVSIYTAFTLLSLGAKSATHDQILTGLGFNLTEISEEHISEGFQELLRTVNLPGSDLQLTISNGLFIDKNLNLVAKFLEESKRLYASDTFSTNFEDKEAAKKQINDYVEKQTQGKIVDLIKEVDPSTVFALVNCIYFKGKIIFILNHIPSTHLIQQLFFFCVSTPTIFHLNVDSVLSHRSLQLVQDHCIATNGEVHYIRLYHSDSSVYNVLLVLLLSLCINSWRAINLYFPKVSMSGNYDLKVLSELGITDVFGNNADLSGITEETKLKLSQAVHKAVLNIDEKGTEASGATAVEAIPMSIPPVIEFNRPFLLFIFERKTWGTLFAGKVMNPNGN